MNHIAENHWNDPRYRRLEMGETVRWTDEVQNDDGSWRAAIGGVGKPAPDPLYTSHRVYRRLKTKSASAIASVALCIFCVAYFAAQFLRLAL